MQIAKFFDNQICIIMKKIVIYFALLSMVLAGAASCAKNEIIVEPPVPSVISMDTSVVDAMAKEGVYSIGYKIDTLVDGATIEAVSMETWVNSFVYDTVSSVISFTVDENTGDDREAVVSVIYSNAEEPAVFTVKQSNPFRIFAHELENSSWEADYCHFHRDSTIFNEVNPELQSELWNNRITAGEYADQYALDWNMANPDNLITSDSALSFEFTETPELSTFYHVYFYEGWVEISDGMVTPAGGANVLRVYGQYEYDEDTGILNVRDISNSLYERDVTYEIKRNGDKINFRNIYMWWPDYLAYYFGDNDRLGFVLPNYDGSRCFIPFGYLMYELSPLVEEDIVEE